MVEIIIACAADGIGCRDLTAVTVSKINTATGSSVSNAFNAATRIIVDLFADTAGIGDAFQRMLSHRVQTGIVGIAYAQAIRELGLDEMIPAVVKRRHPPDWVGDRFNEAARIADLQTLTRRMIKAGQQTACVLAGDANAIGIFDIIELAIGTEHPQQTIQFAQ